MARATTATKKPMAVTKANITRVLTSAGYQKYSYSGLALYGGTDVCEVTDQITGDTVFYATRHDRFSKQEQMRVWEKKYADALKERFRVEQRTIRIGAYVGSDREVWAVFPLDADTPESEGEAA